MTPAPLEFWTIDFETYWDQHYTLSKMGTDEYVLDDRFEPQGMGVRTPTGKYLFFTPERTPQALAMIPWHRAAIIGQNTAFDGFILRHIYKVPEPRLWVDTLSMARAVLPIVRKYGLAALADFFGLPPKGDETVRTRGRRWHTFSRAEIEALAGYCKHDVFLTWEVFQRLRREFPAQELALVDLTLRMFIEPSLILNGSKLQTFLQETKARKAALIKACGMDDRAALMSNEKFADALGALGVEPPVKLSPTTGKVTWAFSKRDPEFKELLEHEDDRVVTLVEARLDNKSTGDETRTERLLKVANDRRPWPVFLHYCGAKTTNRWSGGNKQNAQNLRRGGALREAIEAPPGHVIVVVDSSQIEARTNAAESEQLDLIEDFRLGRDVYAGMATAVYGREISKKTDPLERQVGKTCIAQGQPVLTDHGLVPIECVTTDHRVWDGDAWVTHGGVIDQGVQDVIEYDGLTATTDHEVFTVDGRIVSLGQAASEMVRLQRTGIGGLPVRFADDHVRGDSPRQRLSLHRGPLLGDGADPIRQPGQCDGWQDDIVPAHRQAPDTACGAAGAQVRRDQVQVHEPKEPQVAPVWGARDQATVLQPQALRDLGARTPAARFILGGGDRPHGQRRALRAGEPAACHQENAGSEQTQHTLGAVAGAAHQAGRIYAAQPVLACSDLSAGGGRDDRRADHGGCSGRGTEQAQKLAGHRRQARVYDIANAGPRFRYTVSGCLVLNCILGLGYGMGAPKFQLALKTDPIMPIDMPLEFCNQVVQTYRVRKYPRIAANWRKMERALKDVAAGRCVDYGWFTTCAEGLRMQSGFTLKYHGLRYVDTNDDFRGWWYDKAGVATRIYGAKVVENITQHIARQVVAEQMLQIMKRDAVAQFRHRLALMAHDEVVMVCPEDNAQPLLDYALQVMHVGPKWAPTPIPVAAEGSFGRTYADAK